MPPPGLGRPRPLRRAGLRGRVADARGRRVARIKTNMRRTRWKLRRTDVNASALRVANISLRALSLSRTRSFLVLSFLFFASRGFFLPPRFWVLHVQYHPSHTRHSRKARAQEKFLLFFLPNPPPFPPPLPFLHVMTIQPKPTTCTYISHRIVFPQSAVVEAHLFIIIVFSFPLSFWIP